MMNENSAEEMNPSSTFADKKAANHPAFLQRSVSAPAIAEHVSEAVLPTFNLEQAEADVNANGAIQYPNLPSRLNPRIPTFKKDMTTEEMINGFPSFFADGTQQPPSLSLLNEENALPRDILNSLMADASQARSSLDLNDFGGSSSGFLAPVDGANGNDGAAPSGNDGSLASSRLPGLMSNNATNEDVLEEATKSLQKLYVGPQEVQTMNANMQANMLSQYAPLHAGQMNGLPGTSFFHSPNPGVGTAPGLLGNPAAFVAGQKMLGGSAGMNGEADLSFSLNNGNAPNVANSGGHPGVPAAYLPAAVDLTGALGKFGGNPAAMNSFNPNMQLAMMMGSNPLQSPFNPMMANNTAAAFGTNFPSGQVPAMTQLNPQQAPYYPQQPLYVNNNGQPVFYRPASNGTTYGQEFVYTANAVEGGVPVGAAQVVMGAADQQALLSMQGGFLQYQNLANQVHPGFWTGQPNDQAASMAMYISGQQGVLPGVRMGDDPNNRMLFPPQYANGANNGAAANGGYGMMAMAPAQMAPRNDNLPPVDPNQSNMNASRGYNNNGGMDGGNNDHGARGGDNNGGRGGGRDHHHHRDNNREGRGHRGDRENGRGNKSNNNGGSNQARDALVEDFRTTFGKSRQWTLRDLAGHVVAFCQDQHGSRFIQQRLEICTEAEKQLVFEEIMPSAQVLMTDVFGNYVLQKIFEYGSPEQCEALALLLRGQAVQLSMQMYGCRVVQKALEYVSTERLVELVAEFENPQMLIKCVHDSNGNHVIQKCIEVVSKAAKAAENESSQYLSSRIQFIITAFQGRVKELSSHPYGCRVVQRILEHCTESQKAVILEELRQCCGELVQDCYGNYVIQFVMQHGWEEDRAALIREVQANLLDFSQHKFASNVVEKCLQFASKKDRDEMIWTIINVTFDINNPVDSKGHCVLESMVRDPYANYVVQKVIDVSDERQRAAIMRYVKDNINQLRKYTYGKHIIVRLEKITNEKF